MIPNDLSPIPDCSVGSNKSQSKNPNFQQSSSNLDIDKNQNKYNTDSKRSPSIEIIQKSLIPCILKPIQCCYCVGCSYRCLSMMCSLAAIVVSAVVIATLFIILALISNEAKVNEIRNLSVAEIISTITHRNDQFESFFSIISLPFDCNPSFLTKFSHATIFMIL